MTASIRDFSVLQQSSTNVSKVITMPSGVEKGDLLIAMLGFGAGTSALQSPDGWQLFTFAEASGIHYSFHYKRANDNEPADYTWTESGGTTGCAGAIIAIKSPGAIQNWSAVEVASSATVTCPDITLTTECLVIRAFISSTNGVTEDSGYPAGTTGLFVKASGSSGAESCGASWEIVPAGATGTAAFTLTGTPNSLAISIAIEIESLAQSAPTVDLNRRRVTYPFKP